MSCQLIFSHDLLFSIIVIFLSFMLFSVSLPSRLYQFLIPFFLFGLHVFAVIYYSSSPSISVSLSYRPFQRPLSTSISFVLVVVSVSITCHSFRPPHTPCPLHLVLLLGGDRMHFFLYTIVRRLTKPSLERQSRRFSVLLIGVLHASQPFITGYWREGASSSHKYVISTRFYTLHFSGRVPVSPSSLPLSPLQLYLCSPCPPSTQSPHVCSSSSSLLPPAGSPHSPDGVSSCPPCFAEPRSLCCVVWRLYQNPLLAVFLCCSPPSEAFTHS